MDPRLLLPPVIGAGIGWLTNYVAIKLLFRPLNPVRVFGYRVQGLIPRRRREIALSMARAVEKELLRSDDIAAALEGIDWKQEVEKTVEEAVEHRFGSEKLKRLPVIGLVSENVKYHIKYLLTREILQHLDKTKGNLTARFKESVDIRELMVSRIDALDLRRFEQLLNEFIARELRHLEWLGAIMGFLIGLAQSGVIYFFW